MLYDNIVVVMIYDIRCSNYVERRLVEVWFAHYLWIFVYLYNMLLYLKEKRSVLNKLLKCPELARDMEPDAYCD